MTIATLFPLLTAPSAFKPGSSMLLLWLSPSSGLAQVYDVEDAFKVNDVIEVVGVLSRVPELAITAEDDDSAMTDIDGPSLPPTSKVRKPSVL